MNDQPSPTPLPSQDVTRPSTGRGSAAFINHYRLLQRLGEGGMGEVWLAEQVTPVRRQVAIKVIKAGMDTAHVVARFEAERQALALLDHPAIARVFDGGATGEGRPYFVMEYVKGEAITSYCVRNGLSLDQRLELFLQVCEAVHHAHQKGIIHRDLKPSNLLVIHNEGKPQAKVIDFGLAKAMTQPLTDKTLFTEFGTLVGTPEYMSPEQADLTVLDVDTRADVYSMGVVLYEMLTGTRPFDGESVRTKGLDELRRVIREVDPPRPSTRVRQGQTTASATASVAHLRGDLDWITMRALEKERSRRYGSVAEFAADIRRHLDDLPVVASPPSSLYRARKFVRRHRVGVGAATLVVLVLVAFAGTSALQARRLAAERDRANREAGVSKAVTEFLQNDVLAQASPNQQSGPSTKPDPNLTVRTALDRAASRIEGKFASQPVVEAAIRYTIGNAYHDLGIHDEAQRHLERALDLRRRALGVGHEDTLSAMTSLGDLYREQGQYEKAEALLKDALAALERRPTEDDQKLSAMLNLAIVYRFRGKYGEAEPLYQSVLETHRRRDGPGSNSTLEVMNNLGGLYRLEEKLAASEALLKEGMPLSVRFRGEEHPLTIAFKNNLAVTLFHEKKYGDAARIQREVVAAAKHVFGERHPNTFTSMANLGEILVAEGKYEEAEPLLKEAVEAGSAVQGTDHPNTLLSQYKLGVLYQQRGDYKNARLVATAVVAADRKVLGDEHPQTVNARRLLEEIDKTTTR